MDRSNTFSLTIMVIIMALLAIFIGYLLGNWLIQFVTGDVPPHQQVQEESGDIEEEEDFEGVVTEEVDLDELIEEEDLGDEFTPEDTEDTEEQDPSPEERPLDSVFVVQVGAFSDFENAQKLKQELEQHNYHVVVNDDRDFYRVQLAVDNESEAEATKEELEELGYEAIVSQTTE